MIVVIGAGLAGLNVACTLQNARSQILLVEASPRVGGRISTQRTKSGETEFERGPWRVGETHARVLALCRELGVTLVPSTPPLSQAPLPDSQPGLSLWDCRMRKTLDPAKADATDRRTAYTDQTHAASGSSPYITGAKRYYVTPGGFEQLTDGLAARFVEAGGQLMLDARVQDVVASPGRGGLTVRVSVRDGHNAFKTRRIAASKVVVCIPPHAWRSWTVGQKCQTALDAVQSMPLHHIYASGGTAPQRHERAPSVGQRIPSQYGNKWYQVSYSAGRLADFWYRMSLSYPVDFARLLGRPSRNLRSLHWQHAFHMWRPVFDFDLDRAVAASVEPNPAECPGLYFANESHSSHQAWMEGALEMAERVVARIQGAPGVRRRVPREWVTLDGWIIDVGRWKQVHPGSAQALQAHMREDVSGLFAHVGHSHVARATAHSLKVRPVSPGGS